MLISYKISDIKSPLEIIFCFKVNRECGLIESELYQVTSYLELPRATRTSGSDGPECLSVQDKHDYFSKHPIMVDNETMRFSTNCESSKCV